MATPEQEGKLTRAELKRRKVSSIFTMALSMIREGGVEHLTMRALAERLEMSLSNLQYHFKNKEVLLVALMSSFLEDYLQDNWHKKGQGQQDFEETFYGMLTHSSYEDCAVVFKEVWAMSDRYPALESALNAYYEKVHDLLSEWVQQSARVDCRRETAQKIASLLLPFFEGYCVTRAALPADPALLSKTLSQMVRTLLADSV